MCSLLPSYWLAPLLLGSNYPGPTPYLGPPLHHHVLKRCSCLVVVRSYDIRQGLRFPRMLLTISDIGDTTQSCDTLTYCITLYGM
jgi:hypothetical protein